MKPRYFWSFALLVLAVLLFAFLDLKAQTPAPAPLNFSTSLLSIQLRIGTNSYFEFLANWDHRPELAAYYRGRREALEELLTTFAPVVPPIPNARAGDTVVRPLPNSIRPAVLRLLSDQ